MNNHKDDIVDIKTTKTRITRTQNKIIKINNSVYVVNIRLTQLKRISELEASQ